MSNDLISVIIPVFNVKRYLSKCLESVLNQTYSDLEIILVDDGSTDGSESICDKYQSKDSRVNVIHKKNGGLSDARNEGLRESRGNLVTFIDSDDVVNTKYIQTLYNNLKNYGADISTMRYKRFYSYNELEFENDINEEINIYSPESALQILLYTPEVIPQSAHGKMYRKELFDGISYPVGYLNEDIGTTYLLFAKTNKVVTSNLQYYYYLQRLGSIVRSEFNAKTMDSIFFSEDIIKFMEDNFPNIRKAAICYALSQNIQVLVKLPYRDKRYGVYKNIIMKNIKKYRNIVIFDTKATWQRRLGALSTYGGVCISQKLGELYKKKVNHEKII